MLRFIAFKYSHVPVKSQCRKTLHMEDEAVELRLHYSKTN